MAVESIQCPNCGSPLEVGATDRVATGGDCRARLSITKGASGYPLAVLDDIKVDTALIARETAVRRLERNLADLRRERDALIVEGEHPPRSATSAMGFKVLLIVVIAVVAVPAFRVLMRLGTRLGLVVVLVAVALVLLLYLVFEGDGRKPRRNRPHREREQRLRDMTEEIVHTEQRIETIEAEIDRLTAEL